MFKTISTIIITILIVVAATFLLLFTNSGNTLLKPYISKYASEKSGLDIKIDSFTLKPHFLDVEAYINSDNRVVLNGDIDILKKSFKLDFIATGEANTIKKDIDVNLKGKIFGTLSTFKIIGNGKIFKSNVTFDANIIDFKAKNLHIDMKKAKINETLSLLGKPPYVSGIADIKVNFQNLDINNLKGKANISIPYGSVNTTLVKRDFNISLPPSIIFKAKSNSVLQDKQVVSNINISSNIAKIDTLKTIYNIQNKNFQSDYSLNIPNLSLLKNLIKTSLKGSFKATGEVVKDKDTISYLMSTFSLGGVTKITGINNTLNINAKDLKFDKILYMANFPRYLKADVKITGKIEDIGSLKQSGNINIDINNGKTNTGLVYKDFNISIPNDFMYRDKSHIAINSNDIDFNSDINSTVFDIKIYNGKYNTILKQIEGKYKINIPNLLKLSFLTKRKIVGKAKFDGNFKYYDDMLLSLGKSDIFGADTIYSYKNGDIKVTSKDINTLELSKALGYPPIFSSKGVLEAYYNQKWEKGVFSLTLKDGKMVSNELSNTVYMVSGFDMTKEIYNHSILKGTIQNNTVKFAFDMKSKHSLLKVYSAILNTNNQNINAKYIVKIGDKDIEGDIKGTVDHLKIKVNSSSYIKNKIEKVIEKKVPKKFQQPLKEIFKLFRK